jgi:phenylacetate-coenzyme A ligase PaaK-like adenylate-forming protein
MSTFTSTARAYLNFALGLRRFLNETYSIDDVKSTIRDQITNREENFLNTIRTSIYDYPNSPYLPLLKRAKLTHADIEQLVSRNGLEGTLAELYEAGVYVTFEELKGRIPIKRGDLEYSVTNSDFDNPNLKAILVSQSSGSTGIPTRTKMDFEFLHNNGLNKTLGYHLIGVEDMPKAFWGGMLPATPAIKATLRLIRSGDRMERWFTAYRISPASPSWYYTTLTYLIVGMVRLHGHHMPFPQYTPNDNPIDVAKWASEMIQREGSCFISTTVSKAVRLSLVAQEQGIDLTHLIIQVGGEPSTSAKVKTIEACGAKQFTQYASTEAGRIGIPCQNPSVPNEMHFMSNHLAVIQREVEVLDQSVDAICLTTLLPFSPKMLLNAQTDDFGVVETRDCGCQLQELGLHQYIHTVRSYRKLTGEGVTLVGSDMETILEQVFPSKFGGSLLDYQLVEEEDEQGFTKLLLYVAPHIEIKDEQQLIDTLLNAMKHSAPSVQLAQPEYKQAQTIAIRRQQPVLTPRGKYFSIYTLAMSRQARSEKK